MNLKKIIASLGIFIGGFFAVNAQQVLTLNDAIKLALEQNFTLNIVRNDLSAAQTLNSPGVAGALPTVGLTISENLQQTALEQEFSNGLVVSNPSVRGAATNASLQVGYTLFNGFLVKNTLANLKLTENSSKWLLEEEIQQTISAVISQYINILRLNDNTDLTEKTLNVAKNRVDLLQLRLESGLANPAELAQARIEYENRVRSLQNLKVETKQAIYDLYEILNSSADTNVVLESNFSLAKDLVYGELLASIDQNQEFKSLQMMTKIMENQVKIINSQRMPILRFNTGYNYNFAQNSAGFAIFNQTQGPFINGALGIPIYNGGAIQRQAKAAQFDAASAQLQQESLKLNLQTQLNKSWVTYENLMQQIKADEQLVKEAQSFLTIVEFRYKERQSTNLDFLEAQRLFEEVNYNAINNKYNLQLQELNLLLLGSKLITNY